MKKILIILISSILIALMAATLWYLFFQKPDMPVGEVIKNALPFGSTPTTSKVGVQAPGSTGGKSEGSGTRGGLTSNLFQISPDPVAGAVVLSRGSSTTIVRYVDRATGHIYDTDLKTRIKMKVSNQTLPKIYEAYFRSDGNVVLLRLLKDNSDVVENITVTLTPPKTATPDTLYTASSTILRANIGSVAVGAGNTLFYTMQDPSSIVSSMFNGSGLKTLLTSPFKDWRLASAGKSLVAFTRASASADGYAYTVNTSSGALTKILGPLNGLVVIPNSSGNQILYSFVENGLTKLFAKNLKANTLTEILPATFAEKCLWSIKKVDILYCAAPTDSIGSGEPNSWYMGSTHFSDRIWIFDTKINIAQVLAEPKPSLDIDIDAVDLKLSPNEDYLIFTNKTDLSLWALKVVGF